MPVKTHPCSSTSKAIQGKQQSVRVTVQIKTWMLPVKNDTHLELLEAQLLATNRQNIKRSGQSFATYTDIIFIKTLFAHFGALEET